MENKNKNTKREEKQLTPIQLLKTKPKAMQVGPQPELRKSWNKNNTKELKGGR